MKTLKRIGKYFLQIAEVIVLDLGLLIIAIFAPSKVGFTITEGVKEAKKIRKQKKSKKK